MPRGKGKGQAKPPKQPMQPGELRVIQGPKRIQRPKAPQPRPTKKGQSNETWRAQSRNPPRYLSNVAKQIVSPYGAQDIVATPNLATRQVISKRFTRVLDYVPIDDKFSVFMSPDLFMPGLITNKDVVLIPTVAGPLAFSGSAVYHGTAGTFPGDIRIRGIFKSDTDSAAMHSTALTDSAALTYHGIAIATIAGTTSDIGINIYNKGRQLARVQLFKRIPAGIWTLVGSLMAPAGGTAFNQFTIGSSDALAFRAASVDDSLIDVDFSIISAQATAGTGLAFAPAFTKQIIEDNIHSGRVISMSMKITNTSNALSKGGNITIARVPAVTNPFTAHSDISAAVSVLPPNRKYQDLAATGGFAFWMPEEEDEWAFDSLDNKINAYRNANFLLAHLDGLTAGSSSFRLTFAWVVEFYSPSQIFTLCETPKWDDDWAEMVRLLVRLDAACCNPASADLFKRLYATGSEYLNQAVNHYNMHKDTYHGLLLILKELAPLLLAA